jgi:DNA-binding beta-propeller fold protein YncE
MITALPDGSRVYVLSSTATGAFVTAIDALSERITATIALPGATANPNAVPICQAARYPLSMAAAGDSHRLYVADCVAGSTNIIDTIKNSLVLSLKSPTSAYSPVGNSKYPPPQNPVWVVAGP